MRLRVFLPADERPDPQAFAWKLFDARHRMLREGVGLESAPRAGEVEAVLPAERVLFARLKLPRVNAATIRELLPYAVEDRLLADPAQIHAVAGATNARGETLVAVVDRAWLRTMLEALAGARLAPCRAWCESALLAGGRGDWHVVWGATRALLVDDEAVGAAFDPAPAPPLALRLALDEAAARGERPHSVRMHTRGGEALPDLAQWSEATGVAFSPGARWEEVALAQPAHGAIDLLQGEFAPPARRRLAVPRAAVALAAAIALLQVGFTVADSLRLGRERARLDARAEAIFREAFPEARVVVDPRLQMERNLAELRRSRGLAAGDAFLVELTRLARAQDGAPPPRIEFAGGQLEAPR